MVASILWYHKTDCRGPCQVRITYLSLDEKSLWITEDVEPFPY